MKTKLLIILLTALALNGCASKKLMKDCEELKQDYWLCTEP